MIGAGGRDLQLQVTAKLLQGCWSQFKVLCHGVCVLSVGFFLFSNLLYDMNSLSPTLFLARHNFSFSYGQENYVDRKICQK